MKKIKQLVKFLQKNNFSLKKIEKEKNKIIKKSEIKINKILDPFINPPDYEDSLKAYENHLNNNLKRNDFKGIFIYPKLKEKRNFFNKVETGKKKIYSFFMVFFFIIFFTLFLEVFDSFSLEGNINKNELFKFLFSLIKFYFFQKYMSKKEKSEFFYNIDVNYLKNPIVRKLSKKVFFSFLQKKFEKKESEIRNFKFQKIKNLEIKKFLKIYFLLINESINDDRDYKIFCYMIFLLKKNNYIIDKEEKNHFTKILSNSVFKDNFEYILLILKNFGDKSNLNFDYKNISKQYLENFKEKNKIKPFFKDFSKDFKDFLFLQNKKLKAYTDK